MTKTSAASVRVTAQAVAKSLRMQGIDFRGPCYSQTKGILFVIENQIFLESELVELFAQNKLNREGIQELAEHVETMNAKH